MLTRAEKIYLSMTLGFLAAGSGIQAWRRAGVELGPSPDPGTAAIDSLQASGNVGPVAEDEAASRKDAAKDTAVQATGAAGPPMDAAAGGAIGAAGSPAAEPSGAMLSERSEAAAGKAPSRIDLNRAGADELMRIPGVGAKTAQAILAYRREKGRFRDLSDLLNIKGIGRKKLEKMAPRIIL